MQALLKNSYLECLLLSCLLKLSNYRLWPQLLSGPFQSSPVGWQDKGHKGRSLEGGVRSLPEDWPWHL